MSPPSPSISYVYTLVAPRDLVLAEEPLGEAALGADELVCRTLASAISPGTEIAAYVGLPPLRPVARPYPRYLGYMSVAEVERAGAGAEQRFAPGSLVYTHAAHRDRYRIGADSVLAAVPQGLAPVTASPAYLYRLGWNALRRAGMQPGMSVAVIGLGAIGLATVQLLRHLGATCYAVSSFETALGRAEQSGAMALSRTDARARFLDDSRRDGGLADIVISTTNGWDDWLLALSLARFNGVVSVLGFPGRGEPAATENPLSSRFFYDRQLTLTAAGFAPDHPHTGQEEASRLKADIATLLGWIDEGALDPSQIIISTSPAHEFPQVCRDLSERRAGPGIIVLDWTTFVPSA